MKFYKSWRTYSWVYSRQNCSCISNEACVIPLHQTFYFNDVLQNWNRETVSRMQKSWPFVAIAATSQWRRRLSAVRAHGGHFEHISWCFRGSMCQVIAENFWIWCFNVWLFCLSPKSNLSETFYQVWALRRWCGRLSYRQTGSESLCRKLHHLVTVGWRYVKK